jgi:hypothetical protein
MRSVPRWQKSLLGFGRFGEPEKLKNRNTYMSSAPFHPIAATGQALEPRHPRLLDLLAYWRGKLNGRAMPSRADIDPLEMKAWLGNLVLVEFFGEVARYRVRVDGTNVAEIGGLGRTGKGAEALTSETERNLLFRQYATVFDQHVPAYYETEFTNSEGRYLRESKLLLPLSADGTAVNMILGGIYYHPIQKEAR